MQGCNRSSNSQVEGCSMHRLSLGPRGGCVFSSGTVFMLCRVAARALLGQCGGHRGFGACDCACQTNNRPFSPPHRIPESWLENPGGVGAEPPRRLTHKVQGAAS